MSADTIFAVTDFRGDLVGNVTGSLSGGTVTGDVYGNLYRPGGTTPVLNTGTGGVEPRLYGNVTGNITGDLLGDVTGNVQGVLYGSVISEDSTTTIVNASSGLITGDINSSGTSTFNNIVVEGALDFTTFALNEITVNTLLQVDGTANLAVANIFAGDIDNTRIGSTTPSTIRGTTIEATTKFVGDIAG